MAEPATGKRPTTDGGEPYLKMSELIEATGLPRSTILFYVGEELLPAPVKTSPNMAYYHPSCVDRLAIVRRLQEVYRLSIARIRELVEAFDGGADLHVMAELHEAVFGSRDSDRLDLEAFCRATGLTPHQVEENIAAGVLMPLEKGVFDQEDVAMGRVRRTGTELGIAVDEIQYYRRAAELIVDHEMALRDRVTRDQTFAQSAATTLEMTRMARVVRAYVIDRVFQHRVRSERPVVRDDVGTKQRKGSRATRRRPTGGGTT